MSTIKINSNSDHVAVDFTFQTTQTFTYVIEVEDANGTKLISDSGDDKGKTHFDLGPGDRLLGNFLNIFWVVIDLNGAGNTISATATASQSGSVCEVVQVCSGTSANNSVKRITTADFV